MTKKARVFVSSTVGVLALAFGSTAFAAYNPSLLVAGNSHALGSGGPVIIGVGQEATDDATGVVNIYSPLGYGVTLTQAPGTRIGTLEGVVRVGALGGARVEIQGTVTAQDPSQYVSNACAPGLHNAVWLIESTLAGSPLRVPVYVDRVTAGAEAAFASARIRICLASPYVAPPVGAQAGASLIVAAFSVQNVFSNPGTRGRYPWHAVFVPYTPGTATLNTGNAAQSISITSLPVQLAVTAKRLRRGGRTYARVTVCLNEAGRPIRAIRVNVIGGRSPGTRTRLARPRTNARGCATVTLRVRYRVQYFRATAQVPDRNVTSQGCTPTLAPRCTSVTLAPVFNLVSRNTARVRR